MTVRYTKTLTVSAASTTAVAAAQTLAGAGDMTLASSTVTLPNTGQRPSLTSTGNLSGVNFTAFGTEVGTGRAMTKTIAGPNNNTVSFGVSFATITRIAASGAVGTNTSAGYTAEADLQPLPVDTRNNPTDIAFGCEIISGAPTYTARFTVADVQDTSLDPGSRKWWDHPIVAAQVADNTGNYGKPITAAGLYASGAASVKFTLIQATAG